MEIALADKLKKVDQQVFRVQRWCAQSCWSREIQCLDAAAQQQLGLVDLDTAAQQQLSLTDLEQFS